MLKKISIAVLILLFFIYTWFFVLGNKEYYVKEILSPVEILLDNGKTYKISDAETFDSYFSQKNAKLSSELGISEEEAFILGNLGKYWAENILKGRNVRIINNELIYYKFSYNTKFHNSPYCITNGELQNKFAFDKNLKSIRKANYGILKDNVFYPVTKDFAQGDFILIRKSHYNVIFPQKKKTAQETTYIKPYLYIDNLKLIVSDMSRNLKPDRNCKEEICKEILNHIERAKETIDIAIYGYSSTPAIENAIKDAIKRGVQIRLVYDLDSKGENIYPDTSKFVNLVTNNISDKNSGMVNNIMHNKFYIFDGKTVITGSANLSHTDMSGFNSNNILVINSNKAAKAYQKEFEQMYVGKFHKDKLSFENRIFDNIEIYFSPQDKPLTNAVIPRIKEAQKYIYIPTFFITDYEIVSELINAKKRGVDIKIILDALSASSKYSKHELLRNAGILVKTENFAGKMHAKTILIDDKYLIIGSMNFSNSGNTKNDENLIVLKNREAVIFYKNIFLDLWNKIPDKWLKYNARPESKDSIGSCSDGLDNNYDGLVDLEDRGCK